MKGKRKYAFWMLLLCILLAYSGSKAEAAVKVNKPRIVSITGDKNYATVKWNRVSGAKGYLLYYKEKGGSYRTIRTKKNSYTIYKLKDGTNHYFRVRAYKTYKRKTYYSKYSPTRRFKTKLQKTVQASTVRKFLQSAVKPVGTTLYVWGGGWNESNLDLGGDTAARSIGVSKTWIQFFNTQDWSYDFNNTRYQHQLGLDCSGYVGWCLYNTFNTKNGNTGYVQYAQSMAKSFASRGWGTYRSRYKRKQYKPGDILSSACSCCGHVWICLGQCEDGSVVVLHSTASGGVQISGTVNADGVVKSQSYRLAQAYMGKYFPTWCSYHDVISKPASYLSHYGEFSWDVSGNSILTDPEGVQNMTPEQVLEMLFGPVSE